MWELYSAEHPSVKPPVCQAIVIQKMSGEVGCEGWGVSSVEWGDPGSASAACCCLPNTGSCTLSLLTVVFSEIQGNRISFPPFPSPLLAFSSICISSPLLFSSALSSLPLSSPPLLSLFFLWDNFHPKGRMSLGSGLVLKVARGAGGCGEKVQVGDIFLKPASLLQRASGILMTRF